MHTARYLPIVIACCLSFISGCNLSEPDEKNAFTFYTDSRPYTRWWWFEPYQPVLIEIPAKGKIIQHDIHFIPKTPEVIEGKGRGF